MPCKVDFVSSSPRREQVLNQAAKLQVWLRRQLAMPIPRWLRTEASGECSSDERCVTALCEILTERDGKIPESEDREALELALWWYDHKKADEKRRKAAQRRQRNKKKEARRRKV